ncbi:MAG TPA: metallophosphoesterase [Acidimicrobiales bacterium]|nr:metallophosphoesterase [Acidimicrobiales bacterium]
MALEVTTVADDEVVLHDGGSVHCYDGLAPDTDHTLMGIEVRTLVRPGGALLCRFATVNDVHFGETVCGVLEEFESGPVFTAEPGDPPYPEMMNAGAISEIAEIDPVAVIVKGDLTADGQDDEYAAFLEFYGGAFGDRLHTVRGNHDGYRGQTYESGDTEIVMPGVRVLLLDTVIPFGTTGRITPAQIEWIDDLAATSDRAVMVMGHHHPWSPDATKRSLNYFGINPDDSEALVGAIARHPSILGYFAGHTHRNRVRHFTATGATPYVEVACVKDFPGTWAEYRVFEGGVIQVHRRVSTAEALEWTDKTRAMFAGFYETYAFGELADRCFTMEAAA